jgi:hypothetical protein
MKHIAVCEKTLHQVAEMIGVGGENLRNEN